MPLPNNIPDCFKVLGYDRIPENIEDVERKDRNLAKTTHPGIGDDEEQMKGYNLAYEQEKEELKK